MKKLYIISSPRKGMSKSNMLGDYVDTLFPGETKKIDLYESEVPYITNDVIAYNYGYKKYEDLNESDKKIADLQKYYIDELLSSDVLIISAPMWNFGMPAALKAWFDLIIKVNVTFSMDQNGYKGLVSNVKKAIIVGSRGGVYQGTAAESYDLLNPQIKGLLNFIGITNQETFWLEGANMNPDKLEENTALLKTKINEFVSK